jgi:subtilisin family serine protease
LKANIEPGGIDLVDGKRQPNDMNGHGTHVSGIVAAVGRRAGSVHGVAPRAQILPIRVCGETSCPAPIIAKGIYYAVDAGADVINLSLATGLLARFDGGEGKVKRALRYASSRGVIVVAAAGNSSLPICSEPAASAVCVGSVDSEGSRTLYSNSDVSMQGAYLVAPGGTDLPRCSTIILSTYPRRLDSVCGDSGYEAMNGTSMAAPHVSGVLALLIGRGLTGQAALDLTLRTARDLGPPGPDPIYGHGLVDASAAVRASLRNASRD